MDMRGLSVFISDIRKCTTKEAEQKRIDKELAKIRTKFKNNSGLSGYDRKKYMCKLLYIYMLGYDIDFGHMEAVNLLSSEKYSEKHLGYLACTLLLNENHELLTLITNSIKRDLASKDDSFVCMALTAIANVGGKEFAEVLSQDVQKILVAGETRTVTRKKAALTLLRLYRKYPEILPPDSWSDRVINLLGGRDLGVVTSVMSLLLALASTHPKEYYNAIPKVIRLLTKLIISREYSNDYIYYGIPAPWLQVKLLRFLQLYPPPVEDAQVAQITQILQRIVHGAERIRTMDRNKTVSRSNSIHSVLFEALNLAIHYNNDNELLGSATGILGRYLTDRDTNLRYLSLDTMSRLVLIREENILEAIKKSQDTILLALKDPDISIRRRALDLLYSMCDRTNASQIVGELLTYLPTADFAIREELVLKVAILAEKFATDYSWYVDVILSLIGSAGDFVSDDIWFRVVQIVTNQDENLQRYTAQTVFRAVDSTVAHESAVKIAGYILGEFGFLISDDVSTSPVEQFRILNDKFSTVNYNTKAILLTTFVKFYNMYEDPALRQAVIDVFEVHRDFIDAEIQQRANEYIKLAGGVDDSLTQTVLDNMPPFPERQSSVIGKIADKARSVADRDAPSAATKTGEDEDEAEEQQEEEYTPSAAVEAPAPQKSGNALLDFLDEVVPAAAPAPAPVQPVSAIDDIFQAAPAPAPVHAAPAPAPAPSSIDDFFGGATAAPASSSLAATAAQRASQMSAARESAGVSIDSLITANAQGDESALSKAVQDDAARRYVQLAVQEQGVVMEDQTLQLKVKSEFHGALGRLVLFFGNKAPVPINQVRSKIEEVPEIKFQISQIAPMIPPKTQIQQYISVECLEPFAKDIPLEIFFEHEKRSYKFTIHLPVFVTKFMEPANELTTPALFFGKWNSIPKGAPHEHQSILKANKPIDVAQVSSMLTTGMRMVNIAGIDKNPNNLVCAGYLTTSKQGKIDCLIRLECNLQAQAFRLTTKASNATAAERLHALVTSQLTSA